MKEDRKVGGKCDDERRRGIGCDILRAGREDDEERIWERYNKK